MDACKPHLNNSVLLERIMQICLLWAIAGRLQAAEEVSEMATYTWASAATKCLPDFANRPSGNFSLCVDPQGLSFPKESPRGLSTVKPLVSGQKVRIHCGRLAGFQPLSAQVGSSLKPYPKCESSITAVTAGLRLSHRPKVLAVWPLMPSRQLACLPASLARN